MNSGNWEQNRKHVLTVIDRLESACSAHEAAISQIPALLKEIAGLVAEVADLRKTVRKMAIIVTAIPLGLSIGLAVAQMLR